MIRSSIPLFVKTAFCYTTCSLASPHYFKSSLLGTRLHELIKWLNPSEIPFLPFGAMRSFVVLLPHRCSFGWVKSLNNWMWFHFLKELRDRQSSVSSVCLSQLAFCLFGSLVCGFFFFCPDEEKNKVPEARYLNPTFILAPVPWHVYLLSISYPPAPWLIPKTLTSLSAHFTKRGKLESSSSVAF